MAKLSFSEVYEVSSVLNTFERPPFFGWSKPEQFNSLQEVITEISPFFVAPKYDLGGLNYELLGTKVSYGQTILTLVHKPDAGNTSMNKDYKIKQYKPIKIKHKLLLEVN